MTSFSLGTKRQCRMCNKVFYDLNRDPIICPGCNEEFKSESSFKKRTRDGSNVTPLRKSKKDFLGAEDGGEGFDLDTEFGEEDTFDDVMDAVPEGSSDYK